MRKKEKQIKKESIPIMIVLICMVLNFPMIGIITNLGLKYEIETNIIGSIMTVETISFGASILYANFIEEKKKRGNYKKCQGEIVDFNFSTSNGSLRKKQVISYEVNGKEYQTKSRDSFGGILSVFLKGIKVTVYYDENAPEQAHVPSLVTPIVGGVFIIVGIYAFYILLVTTLK